MYKDSSLKSIINSSYLTEFPHDYVSFNSNEAVIGLYFFKGNVFTRKPEVAKQILRQKRSVFLKYFYKDGKLCVSPEITQIYFAQTGDCVCILPDKKRLYLKRRFSKIRVINKPVFLVKDDKKEYIDIKDVKKLIDDKKDVYTDIIDVKKLIDGKKKVYAVFTEGNDTICTTSIIISITIPNDGSEVRFNTEKMEYMIFNSNGA